MESELKIARNIQMGILPKEFPPFPDRKDFDIHALTIPAREVGGDFYDFFLIDRDHLCIVIGDASGKGIPAAIFMAFTKTLIKAKASVSVQTGTLMEEVNDELSRGNPADMFITVFCAILNTATGDSVYERRPQSACHHSRTGDLSYLTTVGGSSSGSWKDAIPRDPCVPTRVTGCSCTPAVSRSDERCG